MLTFLLLVMLCEENLLNLMREGNLPALQKIAEKHKDLMVYQGLLQNKPDILYYELQYHPRYGELYFDPQPFMVESTFYWDMNHDKLAEQEGRCCNEACLQKERILGEDEMYAMCCGHVLCLVCKMLFIINATHVDACYCPLGESCSCEEEPSAVHCDQSIDMFFRVKRCRT